MGVKRGASYTKPVLLGIIAFVEHFHVAGESVQPLQYYCKSIPLLYIVDERRLINQLVKICNEPYVG